MIGFSFLYGTAYLTGSFSVQKTVVHCFLTLEKRPKQFKLKARIESWAACAACAFTSLCGALCAHPNVVFKVKVFF